jgi:hypothetical protein
MANRRFEMYEYRQVFYRMRLGESNRAIAQAGPMFYFPHPLCANVGYFLFSKRRWLRRANILMLLSI